MPVVFDASAILAFLQDETGSKVVEDALERQTRCSAVNWSEVAQKVLAAGKDWNLVAALLHSYELGVEPFGLEDAEGAAELWEKGDGLSIADRACLALGARLESEVLTADSAWGTRPGVIQIR